MALRFSFNVALPNGAGQSNRALSLRLRTSERYSACASKAHRRTADARFIRVRAVFGVPHLFGNMRFIGEPFESFNVEGGIASGANS